MPDQSLLELLTGYAAAPLEYFGYGKRPPPRVDAPVRSASGFGFEDPEARAFADRYPTTPNLDIANRISQGAGMVAQPFLAARDSLAEGVDLAQRAGLANSLAAVPVAGYEAGKHIVKEGINTGLRWLDATHQLPGARATDEVVYPEGKPDLMQVNPNGLQQHDFLAPLGLAGMGNPVSALGRESASALARAGRPSARAVLPPDISAKLNPQSHIDMSDEARLARAREQGFNTDETMYHGTNERFDAFQRDRSDMNEISGNYFTADRSEAATYGDNVGSYYLRMRQPIRLEMTPDGWRAMDKADADKLAAARVDLTKIDANKLTRSLERLGYDGAEQWTRGASGKMERFWTTVFDPKNIRSTRATFDPISENNPSLLLSDAGKRSSLPGMIANASERPTAGTTPLSERGYRLESAKQGLSEPAPYVERGDRNSTLVTSKNPGGEKYFADIALRQARGDYDKALALLKDNPEAANVLRYWKDAGYSFRAYEDPARSQSYWSGLDEFNRAQPPFRLSANPEDGRGALPGAVANALDQGGTTASRNVEKVTPASRQPIPIESIPLDRDPPSSGVIRAYHGTMSDFEKFERGESIGPHFGTPGQASDIVSSNKSLRYNPTPNSGARIIPADIDLRNSIVMRDSTWSPREFLSAIDEAGIKLTPSERSAIDMHGLRDALLGGKGTSAARQALLDRGIDGIWYKNEQEGAGWSLIPLRGEGQVKSPTSGSTLYSNDKRAGIVGAAANAQRRIDNPIKAYHGSPHDFERFDSSKIGTGEGAQAFGHGLYFSENPAVARSYRDNLAAASKTYPRGSPEATAKTALEMYETIPEAVDGLRREAGMKWMKPEEANNYRLAADILENDKLQPGGRLYEVSLHAKPEEFLDWDLPLSQQSEGVRKALNNAYKKSGGRNTELPADMLGWDAVERIWALHKYETAKPDSANSLREAGIKGIRYKDQGSRGKEGGTSNYVVFPGAEDIIEIIGKDGKPLQGAERADAVKKLYARQGMPIPGQDDQQDTPSLKGFGGKVPQDIRRGFGGPIPNRN